MSNKIHLPGLNGLRAIAAIVVFLFHFDIAFTKKVGLTCYTIYHSNYQASLAVTLFFVLSGYLISFLLLKEKEKFKTVNLKFFYLRRILRIWPLYYLIIICTFLFNKIFYQYNIFHGTTIKPSLLYVLLGGNFVEPFFLHNITYYIAPLTILWSLCVEEQFYLFWPILIKNSKNILRSLLIFLSIFIIFKLYTRFFLPENFLAVFDLTRLDCMAIGSIGAVIVGNKKIMAIIYNKVIQLISWIIFISAFIIPLHIFSFIDQDVYAVTFLIIILNLANNEHSLVSLENRLLVFLGKNSYGIYMYHMLIFYVLVKFMPLMPNKLYVYFSSLVFIFTLVILIAYLSNKFFERYFLNKKDLLAKIKTSF